MEPKINTRKRTKGQKEAIIEQLKTTPIVQVACRKGGIGRATYYRWRKSDLNFTKASDEALLEGSLLVNDIAESQLMEAIRDKNLTAIIFWLKHHHPTYATRVEVMARVKHEERLTPEQEKLVDKALKLALLHTQSKEEETS